MIRTASQLDIDYLLEITQACARHLSSSGIHQWNENYPNETAFRKDVERGELYVLELDNAIVGCIVLTQIVDTEYSDIKWLTENNNVYIHRLAIHPDYQGKGYAQQLMDFAEAFAIENAYASIRLDTFSLNTRNQKFYELRGYKRLGNIYFPNQSEHPFYCYELVL